MADEAPVLTEVRRVPEAKAVSLKWSDDFEAQPSYRMLCGFCPCAGCQGHGGKVVYHDPGQDVEPSTIEAVGNYAIRFLWKDGCHDGIYSFSFLRQICASGEKAG